MLKPLTSFAHDVGQIEAARRLGLSQSAISKALRSGRKVFVFEDGVSERAFELKSFPCSSAEICPSLEQMISRLTTSEQSNKSAVQPSSTQAGAA